MTSTPTTESATPRAEICAGQSHLLIKKTSQCLSSFFGAREATMLELLYNIAEWLYEHGKQELFTMPELPQLPLEKLLPEIQYAF